MAELRALLVRMQADREAGYIDAKFADELEAIIKEREKECIEESLP